MKTYLYKFLGYLLISLALALAFGPFDGNPFAKKYDAVQMEKFCQQYPQSCESMKEENSHKLFVTYPGLAYLKYLSGFILLIFGIAALRKSYKQLTGIRINTGTATVAIDSIGIIFLSFAAYCVWASLFHHLTEAKIFLYDYDGDAPALNMTALFFVPAVGILSFFTSNFSGQSIEIGPEGITLHYPDSEIHLTWNLLTALQSEQTYTLAGGNVAPAPRDMQRKLVLKTTETSHELYEPGTKQAKEKIIEALSRYAPSRLAKDIEQLRQTW